MHGTLQHTNTLQRAATHCNALQQGAELSVDQANRVCMYGHGSYTCDVTHAYVAWLIHVCVETHSYVESLIRMCDVTHSYVRCDSFICGMTHAHV